jgi:hypothetical protein
LRVKNEAKSRKKTQELIIKSLFQKESKTRQKRDKTKNSREFFFFDERAKKKPNFSHITCATNAKSFSLFVRQTEETKKNDDERRRPPPRRRRSSSSFGGGVRESVATGVRDADEEICGPRVFERRERRKREEW